MSDAIRKWLLEQVTVTNFRLLFTVLAFTAAGLEVGYWLGRLGFE